jgi:PAS domain S-box-containing protein
MWGTGTDHGMGIRRVMRSFENLSIRKKVLYSTVIMFFLIGMLSSLAYWLIFIPNLVEQIHQHGLRVAYSLVTRSRSYILSDNRPELTFMLFQKKRIEKDLSYIFITDSKNRILAHTFIGSIPSGIQMTNMLGKNENEKIKLIVLEGESIYDGAVSIKTGLKNIGVVHIGLGKKPVDAVTKEIGLILIMVMALIILLATLLSNLVANYISRPLSKLVRAMNDLCKGEIKELPPAPQPTKCWEMLRCDKKECPVYKKEDLICWFMDGTLCHGHSLPKTLEGCYDCDVYKKLSGNEIVQLSNAFTEFIHTLQLKTNEIRTSEEKYRLLFNYDPNPLFAVEMKQGNILDANNPALETYQYEREELTRISILNLFHEEDAALFWKEIRNPGKEYFFMPKVRAKTRDLQSLFVDVHARVAKFQDVGLPFLIISTVNITQRLEQEAQLRLVQQELIKSERLATIGETVTGLAHYIKNILNGLRGGMYKINSGMNRDKPLVLNDGWEMAQRNVEKISELVLDLLSYSKERTPQRKRFNPNEIVLEVVESLQHLADDKGVKLSYSLDSNIKDACLDPKGMHRVLLNLVSNAVDACVYDPDQSKPFEVVVNTGIEADERGKDIILFEVTDNGCGMNREVRQKLFNRFFSTKKEQGTGIGLLITHKIIQEHGGEILVESEEGAGTTFRVRLDRETG